MTKAHRLKERSSGEALAVGLNFLLGASDRDLDSFELLKLATVSDLRKELHGIFDRIIEETAQAAVARWFKVQNRETLKNAIENEETAMQWAQRMIREGQRKPEELIPRAALEPGVAHRAAAMRYQQRNVAEGKCQNCPKPLAPTSNRYCEKHLAMARDRKTPNRAAEPGTRGYLYGDADSTHKRGPRKKKSILLGEREIALLKKIADEMGLSYQTVRRTALALDEKRRGSEKLRQRILDVLG